MPRRYLVDVHHVVARDRYAAKMHMLTAGGFVAAVLLILLVHVFGFESEWLAGLLLGACAIMAVGALMVALRRWEAAATVALARRLRAPALRALRLCVLLRPREARRWRASGARSSGRRSAASCCW